MSSLVAASTAPAVEDDISDDLFACLPHAEEDTSLDIVSPVHEEEEDLMATLPSLPSLEGLATRLTDVNLAIDAARAEADSLKNELQQKAKALRAMAAALESI